MNQISGEIEKIICGGWGGLKTLWSFCRFHRISWTLHVSLPPLIVCICMFNQTRHVSIWQPFFSFSIFGRERASWWWRKFIWFQSDTSVSNPAGHRGCLVVSETANEWTESELICECCDRMNEWMTYRKHALCLSFYAFVSKSILVFVFVAIFVFVFVFVFLYEYWSQPWLLPGGGGSNEVAKI